jgi:hypothetical protein
VKDGAGGDVIDDIEPRSRIQARGRGDVEQLHPEAAARRLGGCGEDEGACEQADGAPCELRGAPAAHRYATEGVMVPE